MWVIGNDKVGNDYGIYAWTGSTWAKEPGAAVRIAVDPQGRAWVVNSGHQIFRWTGSTWQQMPGLAVDVGIGANGAVFVVSPSGNVFRFNGNDWTMVDGILTSIAVDPVGRPWGVNPSRQIWASTMTPPTPTLAASGPAGTWKGGAQSGNYPANMPCPSVTYTVPADISYVQITATGGAARDGGGENVVSNLGATGATATDHGDSSPVSPGFASISGGSGGRGATVTGTFRVTPGQALYVVTGTNGSDSYQNTGLWGQTGTFPGGGAGETPGGGFSMVSLELPARTLPNDPNYCYVRPAALLVVAGGGGGAGGAGGAGSGGTGGDAGLVGQAAGSGGSGGGGLSGGGAGGGTQTAGGAVGSHPGCGSEARYNGSYLRGSDNDGAGGSGGGGYYGGGAGGGGDCILETGNGGGGGGSSYAAPTAMSVSSSIDTTRGPSVVIQPMK